MTSDEQYVAKQQVLAAFEHGCSVQNLLSTTSIPLHRATLYRLRQRLQTDPETVLSDGRHGHRSRGRHSTEPLSQRALAVREQQLGPLHPDTAQSVWWLATLSEHQQQYEKAASLYQRALSIFEHALGPQHPRTQNLRANYAHLLRTMGRDAEAAALDQP